MQWLYKIVGQAGIFLICAQTIVHFRPKESYEKYLKLLLSVMLLIQLLQPVLTLLGDGESPGIEAQVSEFTGELQSVLTRASAQAKEAQEEVQNTADAIAQQTESGQMTGQDVESSQESGEISVEVEPVRLE